MGELMGAQSGPRAVRGAACPSSRAGHLCQNSSRSHQSHSEISDGSLSSRVSR